MTSDQQRDERPTERALDAGETLVVPVFQEFARVAIEKVENGRVLIHTSVVERNEVVEATVSREDVHVERKPIGSIVDEMPVTREEGDVLIIPVVEEVFVVVKRLMLREEVHIRRERSQQATREDVRLRTEVVRVEQRAPGHSPDEAGQGRERA